MRERFEVFTVLINKISRNVRKIKNQEMSEYGLRAAHISCLYYLYAADSLTATELCERCEEDKATISRALNYLEDKGFIVRESKVSKRYRSPLLLTEKGSEVGKKICDAIDRVLDEVGAGLSDEQRKSFYSSLAVISDNLEIITDRIHEVKEG